MDELTPSWQPTQAMITNANLTALMADAGFRHYDELHRWSVLDPMEFWGAVIDRLGIVFSRPPDAIGDGTAEHQIWLRGARMNIVDSCFTAASNRIAVVHRRSGVNHEVRLSGATGRSGTIRQRSRQPGNRAGGAGVALAMPMTIESVIAYLGTVAAGGVVVSIADSFAVDEIRTRLRFTDPVLMVTQDQLIRTGRVFPMYDKVVEAGADRCVVVETGADVRLRQQDIAWRDFLSDDATLTTVQQDPAAHTNILFSSGTTGEPKAIPWTHVTPIKAAMDGRYHQDIHAADVVAWPANLGWMMGPWLIYATLINEATFALYDDVPTGRGFVEFVADIGVTVLGLVPSIVSVWRSTGVLDDTPWAKVRVLSSTGEASAPDDYNWLMNQAGGVPVIELLRWHRDRRGVYHRHGDPGSHRRHLYHADARHRHPHPRRCGSRSRYRGAVSGPTVDRDVARPAQP